MSESTWRAPFVDLRQATSYNARVKSAFVPRLVNGPFGDPGLYVSQRWHGRALLFDLGRIDRVPAGELLRVTHVFVTHTHIDHFIGFDHLLRIFLARDLQLEIFGPPGIIANVRGKLAGYTWNLVDGYGFVITVHEVGMDGRVRWVRLPAATSFTPDVEGERPFEGVVLADPHFSVHATILDHRIPCLGYAVREERHLNVRTDELERLGIPPGPWLAELKDAVREGAPDDTAIVAEWRENGTRCQRRFMLVELRDRLIVETPGQAIAYVTDIRFTAANAPRIAELAREVDVFFCESLFVDVDRDQAAKRYHLTARQAGTLARMANAKRLDVFHFSPRYEGDAERLRREAAATFAGEIAEDVPD
ncbi:MAG TPA: MBL fold metallo-hydrolase [Candidatus Binatia bacterium]|nr:MBL fold metallo-hydrolase [Candidatus Binatia bacterium]